MKTIFVVERTDNHGEFQPTEYVRKSRSEAKAFMVGLAGDSSKKFRVMPYVRQENRS